MLKGKALPLEPLEMLMHNAKNFPNAMLYYYKAIDVIRSTGDSVLLATIISNAGDAFLQQKKFDSALYYFKESGQVFEKVDYPTGKAYNMGNLGMVYANTGQKELAEKNINEAIRMLEEMGDYSPICIYLISMSDIYAEKGDGDMAYSYALRSLTLAEQYKMKDQVSEASLKLSALSEKSGDKDAALRYYKKHITFRDSVNDINTVQKMANLRTDFEVSQKQVEVDLLNQEKKNQRIMLISLFIILGSGDRTIGNALWILPDCFPGEKKIRKFTAKYPASRNCKGIEEKRQS